LPEMLVTHQDKYLRMVTCLGANHTRRRVAMLMLPLIQTGS